VESIGILYVETSNGAVYALQGSSGTQLWHAAAPQGLVVVDRKPFFTPVVANGLVYAGGLEGVTAYRATDGRVVWRYQMYIAEPFPAWPGLVSGVIYFALMVANLTTW
jgi:outer membrane protein assembly factor BamB